MGATHLVDHTIVWRKILECWSNLKPVLSWFRKRADTLGPLERRTYSCEKTEHQCVCFMISGEPQLDKNVLYGWFTGISIPEVKFWMDSLTACTVVVQIRSTKSPILVQVNHHLWSSKIIRSKIVFNQQSITRHYPNDPSHYARFRVSLCWLSGSQIVSKVTHKLLTSARRLLEGQISLFCVLSMVTKRQKTRF